MEKFVLAVLDGSRCVDKIKFKKSEIDKGLNAIMTDKAILVSESIAAFIEKYK